jgi:hypothetical protein
MKPQSAQKTQKSQKTLKEVKNAASIPEDTGFIEEKTKKMAKIAK